jgi:hypothetical protein
MSKRDFFLMLVLCGGAGYGIHANWDKIQAKLGLDDLRPGRVKAIELCKKAQSFEQYRSNWEVLRDRVANEEIQVVGDPWTATAVDEKHYRVILSFKLEGQLRRHAFDVDMVTNVVVYAGELDEPPAPR